MNRKEIRAYFRNINAKNKLIAKKVKGAFGGKKRFLGDYKSLKVIRLSEREKINCNALGILMPENKELTTTEEK